MEDRRIFRYENIVKHFHASDAEGHSLLADVHTALAECYDKGQGTEENKAKALLHHLKAAEHLTKKFTENKRTLAKKVAEFIGYWNNNKPAIRKGIFEENPMLSMSFSDQLIAILSVLTEKAQNKDLAAVLKVLKTDTQEIKSIKNKIMYALIGVFLMVGIPMIPMRVNGMTGTDS